MEDPKNNGGEGNGSPDTKNTNSDQKVTDTKKPDAGSQSFNPEVLGEADWDKVFSSEKLWTHPRFKELTEAGKRLKQLEADQQKAEEDKLKEQGKLKELLDKKEEELKALRTQAETSRIDSLITNEAVKKGVIDPEAVTKLLDRTGVKITEDGSVNGITEAVAKLIESKPYLINGKPVTMGSGSNPASGAGSPPRFKHSQIKDPVFYREHEKEINEAMKLGLIENDLK